MSWIRTFPLEMDLLAAEWSDHQEPSNVIADGRQSTKAHSLLREMNHEQLAAPKRGLASISPTIVYRETGERDAAGRARRAWPNRYPNRPHIF